jgi:hypothetical protein
MLSPTLSEKIYEFFTGPPEGDFYSNTLKRALPVPIPSTKCYWEFKMLLNKTKIVLLCAISLASLLAAPVEAASYLFRTATPGVKSPDAKGDSWKLLPQALPKADYWEPAPYIDGKFMAISSENILRSTDGKTWTLGGKPGGLPTAITHGAGKYMVVGSSYAPYVSADGVRWTQTASLPAAFRANGVAYGNGRFVVISDSEARAAYSTDGHNWTAATLPVGPGTSRFWKSIAFGNGKFVAASGNNGTSTVVVASSDGITWTAGSMPVVGFWKVRFLKDKFIATGGSGGLAYSTDGLNWTKATMPHHSYEDVAYGNGTYVAISSTGTRAAVSKNGISWTQNFMPTNTGNYTVMFGNGMFVTLPTTTTGAFTK